MTGVCRSAFYAWKQSPTSAKEQEDKSLSNIIKISLNEGRETYGTRRIQQDLMSKNLTVSRRRIGRLMESEGLKVKTKRKFKATTYSDHDDPIAPNHLQRQFDVAQPDTHYVGDITYISTKQGWLYLATVIDLYSRRIVGWSMADNMRRSLLMMHYLWLLSSEDLRMTYYGTAIEGVSMLPAVIVNC